MLCSNHHSPPPSTKQDLINRYSCQPIEGRVRGCVTLMYFEPNMYYILYFRAYYKELQSSDDIAHSSHFLLLDYKSSSSEWSAVKPTKREGELGGFWCWMRQTDLPANNDTSKSKTGCQIIDLKILFRLIFLLISILHRGKFQNITRFIQIPPNLQFGRVQLNCYKPFCENSSAEQIRPNPSVHPYTYLIESSRTQPISEIIWTN